MEEDYSFFEENFFIAIRGDGRTISVPRRENEYAHWLSFLRLDKKIGLSIMINRYCTVLNGPNIFAKDGYIIIYPINIAEEEIKKILFGVVFPYKPTKEQLSSFAGLYNQLEKIKVRYFEKPSIYSDLDYEQIKIGLDNLKKFVEKNLELLSKQVDLGEERE